MVEETAREQNTKDKDKKLRWAVHRRDCKMPQEENVDFYTTMNCTNHFRHATLPKNINPITQFPTREVSHIIHARQTLFVRTHTHIYVYVHIYI